MGGAAGGGNGGGGGALGERNADVEGACVYGAGLSGGASGGCIPPGGVADMASQ